MQCRPVTPHTHCSHARPFIAELPATGLEHRLNDVVVTLVDAGTRDLTATVTLSVSIRRFGGAAMQTCRDVMSASQSAAAAVAAGPRLPESNSVAARSPLLPAAHSARGSDGAGVGSGIALSTARRSEPSSRPGVTAVDSSSDRHGGVSARSLGQATLPQSQRSSAERSVVAPTLSGTRDALTHRPDMIEAQSSTISGLPRVPPLSLTSVQSSGIGGASVAVLSSGSGALSTVPDRNSAGAGSLKPSPHDTVVFVNSSRWSSAPHSTGRKEGAGDVPLRLEEVLRSKQAGVVAMRVNDGRGRGSKNHLNPHALAHRNETVGT